MSMAGKSFAETTGSLPTADVLSDVLQSMRIRGHLLLHEEYVPPWAVAVPDSVELARLIAASRHARAIAFHLVLRGQMTLLSKNGEKFSLGGGDLAVCFGGEAHQLRQGSSVRARALESMVGPGAKAKPPIAERGRGTLLLCGAFLVEHTHLNPLLAALPPVLGASITQWTASSRSADIVDRLVREVSDRGQGSAYVIERVLELLCAEAVRSHADSVSERAMGWLAALRDPAIGRAIAQIHSRPGEGLSVESLARGAALSPSRFAARFAAALGEGPMSYAAKWRMNIACRLLRDTDRSISQISAEVGYENLAAFSRAFKRHVGIPPGAWRHGTSVASDRAALPRPPGRRSTQNHVRPNCLTSARS